MGWVKVKPDNSYIRQCPVQIDEYTLLSVLLLISFGPANLKCYKYNFIVRNGNK
jgi:hypothetical protein